jgi:transcriptional regulator
VYKLPYYTENDQVEILTFLNDHPLALITGQGMDGRPVATHVPVLFEERDGKLLLTGHIMRNTDHWHGFQTNSEVLCVFTGPNCHVSASWYSNKMSGSTWNYMSVQAQGKLRFLDNDGLINLLRKLTNRYENDPESGSNFEDLDSEYIDKMVSAIQAFEVCVTNLDATFKLSQNRDLESYDNIIEKLLERGGDSANIAEELKRRRSRVFPA